MDGKRLGSTACRNGCVTRGRDGPPGAVCRRSRPGRCPCCPRLIPEHDARSAAPTVRGHVGRRRAGRPKRAPAKANVGRAAGAFKAGGSGKSGKRPAVRANACAPARGRRHRAAGRCRQPARRTTSATGKAPAQTGAAPKLSELEPSCIGSRRIYRHHRQRHGKRT